MAVTNNIFLFHSAIIDGITDPSKYNLRDYYIKTAYNCCCGGEFKNDYVSTDALKKCISQGARVLDFDIYSINDDGNLLDASAIGAVAALKMTRLPALDEDNKVKYGEFTDTPLPLTESTPFTMTFYKIGDKLLIDPNRDEQDAADSRLTLGISKVGKEYIISSSQKGEIAPLSGEDLKTIVSKLKQIDDDDDCIKPIISKIEASITCRSKMIMSYLSKVEMSYLHNYTVTKFSFSCICLFEYSNFLQG